MVGKCKFCKFEKDSKCSKKKNATVKLNKRRPCKLFVVDEDRAADFLERRERNKIDVIDMPSWYWIRDLRRAKTTEAKAEEMSQFTTTAVPTDNKHPLTGDLSKFTTTAPPTEEE